MSEQNPVEVFLSVLTLFFVLLAVFGIVANLYLRATANDEDYVKSEAVKEPKQKPVLPDSDAVEPRSEPVTKPVLEPPSAKLEPVELTEDIVLAWLKKRTKEQRLNLLARWFEQVGTNQLIAFLVAAGEGQAREKMVGTINAARGVVEKPLTIRANGESIVVSKD